jgi:predicted transcriptional regulator
MPSLIIELSDDAAWRLERLCRKTNATPAMLAEQAVEIYLDTEEWQITDIEAGVADARHGNFVSEEQAGLLFRQWLG